MRSHGYRFVGNGLIWVKFTRGLKVQICKRNCGTLFK